MLPSYQAAAFAELQATYFPVWPATINWGALQYHDPTVQLQMVQQWEAVTSTGYYTDVDAVRFVKDTIKVLTSFFVRKGRGLLSGVFSTFSLFCAS